MSNTQTVVAEIILHTRPGANIEWALNEALQRAASEKKTVHLIHQGERYMFDFDTIIATAKAERVIVDDDAYADAKADGNSE